MSFREFRVPLKGAYRGYVGMYRVKGFGFTRTRGALKGIYRGSIGIYWVRGLGFPRILGYGDIF